MTENTTEAQNSENNIAKVIEANFMSLLMALSAAMTAAKAAIGTEQYAEKKAEVDLAAETIEAYEGTDKMALPAALADGINNLDFMHILASKPTAEVVLKLFSEREAAAKSQTKAVKEATQPLLEQLDDLKGQLVEAQAQTEVDLPALLEIMSWLVADTTHYLARRSRENQSAPTYVKEIARRLELYRHRLPQSVLVEATAASIDSEEKRIEKEEERHRNWEAKRKEREARKPNNNRGGRRHHRRGKKNED